MSQGTHGPGPIAGLDIQTTFSGGAVSRADQAPTSSRSDSRVGGVFLCRGRGRPSWVTPAGQLPWVGRLGKRGGGR